MKAKNKNILLLGALHPDIKFDWKHKKNLPETVEFYIENKCGVDIVEQVARKYSVRSASRQ